MKYLYLNAIMLCLILSACDNETSGVGGNSGNGGNTNDGDTQEQLGKILGKECAQDGTCVAPMICNASKICVEIGKEGAVCDSLHRLCEDPFVCHNSHCRRAVDKGMDCGIDIPCKREYVCFDGKCVDGLPPGEACDNTRPCDPKSGLCLNNVCKSWLKHGDSCADLNDSILCERMTSEYEYKCMSGTCTAFGKDGMPCDNEEKPCYGTLICAKSGVCRKPQQNQGDTCGDDQPCADRLVCINNICENQVEPGGDCHGNSDYCIPGAYCNDDKKCSVIGEACDADQNNCPNDSYCCVDPEKCKDGTLNRCVQFSENTSGVDTCKYETRPGIFDATVQCRWHAPNDDVPDSVNVEMGVLVGNLGNTAELDTVVVFPSYATETSKTVTVDGKAKNVLHYNFKKSVYRIINPKNCSTLETIRHEDSGFVIRWSAVPAIANVDDDPESELFVLAYKETDVEEVPGTALDSLNLYVERYDWDGNLKKHKRTWVSSHPSGASLSLYDLIPDIPGPEVIDNYGNVFINAAWKGHAPGTRIASGISANSRPAAIADYNGDGIPDFVGHYCKNGTCGFKFASWNDVKNAWDIVTTTSDGPAPEPVYKRRAHLTAFADFGTPGTQAKDFNYDAFDGIPEIVVAGGDQLLLLAFAKVGEETQIQRLLQVDKIQRGGPPTVADFDKDGKPEIGLAGTFVYGVYDPRCIVGPDGLYVAGEKCQGAYCQNGMPDGTTRLVNGENLVTADICTQADIENHKIVPRNFVKWERLTQDASSANTGSAVFDFDGDGQAEAVYADECFTRIYDGSTGEVQFSSMRSSWTALETPVIADVDNDGSAEILMGSDHGSSCNLTKDTVPFLEHIQKRVTVSLLNKKNKEITATAENVGVDKSHRGLKCIDDKDCGSKMPCVKGLCRCIDHKQCATKMIIDGVEEVFIQNICVPPMAGDEIEESDLTAATQDYKQGHVCRAARVANYKAQNLTILKDRYDRWTSARNLWNQHNYFASGIDDASGIPAFKVWYKLFADILKGTDLEKKINVNSYRMNVAGKFKAGTAPDLTVKLDQKTCRVDKNTEELVLTAWICNRGTKPVAEHLPVTFHILDGGKSTHLCTELSPSGFPVGYCNEVTCKVENAKSLVGKTVRAVANEDNNGERVTVECNENNNFAYTDIKECPAVIIN